MPTVCGRGLIGQSAAQIVTQNVSRQQRWLDGFRTARGIVGDAQHATATTRRGVKTNVVLVVTPTLSSHSAERG